MLGLVSACVGNGKGKQLYLVSLSTDRANPVKNLVKLSVYR